MGYLLNTHLGSNGYADLCSFFVRRMCVLLGQHGVVGVVTTNSIAKGETRASGLDHLLRNGATVYRAVRSTNWPGAANVFISLVYLHKGIWHGQHILDDMPVAGISSFLDAHTEGFHPYRLQSNAGSVFRGPTVGGEGFILSVAERDELIAANASSSEVIKPFLTGQDINQHPEQFSERYAIDFQDFEEQRAREYVACWNRLYDTVPTPTHGQQDSSTRKILVAVHWTAREALRRHRGLLQGIGVRGSLQVLGGVLGVPRSGVCWKGGRLCLTEAAYFSVLNSAFHTEWAEKTASRLKEESRIQSC